MRNRIQRISLDPKFPGAKTFNDWVDKVCNVIDTLLTPSGTGNITITTGPMGQNFHVPAFPIGVGKTTGTIAARSTSTPGTGTADIYLWNGTDFVADAARTGVTVYNFSGTAGGVPTGKYFIWIKLATEYFIIAVEC